MRRQRQDHLFQKWLDEHKGIILKVVRAFSADPEEQDDLFQDIVIQLWMAVSSYRGKAKPATWIYRVAMNRALTWRRGEEREHHRRDQVLEWPTSEQPDDGHADQLEQLYAEIRQLPPLDRSLVLLHLDGFSHREIADTVGLTENNVGVRLSRCRKRLAEKLRD
ncbi:MAG: sigma-70 family RNA polymerase sigma factor [Gemmatimonadetes bacterium]|jgi:RNA polymerase sigma-70 factor, ECF subfamily|nr:sigma-70 family RNA polymerase sigma factor [Gemmatimonadota bacterium]